MKQFTIKAEMWKWQGGEWRFVYVSDKDSEAIKKSSPPKRGFGSVPVEATCGKSVWKTSIFPTKEGPYIMPIKKKVRKDEGLFDGDVITIKCKRL